MATNNRGGNRGGSNRRGRNNNPEGRNQYSGLMGSARENPLATAAAVGGAVAAGVFLWSRRNQISDQLGNLSEQISEWRDGWSSESDFSDEATATDQSFMARPARRNSRRSQTEISEEALTLKETGKTV